MQYAIELYYDEKTENKLMNLAQIIADEKNQYKVFGMENTTAPYLSLF